MPNFRNPPTFHCHLQSLDSASTPEAFAAREKELGTGVLTCTDHGTMSACITALNLAKKNGLILALGVEYYWRDPACKILKDGGIDLVDGDVTHYIKYGHFTGHFLDQEAYETSCRLISRAKMEKHGSEEKPIFTWADIEELGSKRFTAGSGCLVGIVSRHLLAGRADLAAKFYDRYRSCFRPGHLFAEIFPHRCTHNWVKGIFVHTNLKTHKFWPSKKLKTSNSEKIEAQDLATQFDISPSWNVKLLGIYNNRKLTETDEIIERVEDVEDFIENDCVQCVDGKETTDVQEMANKFIIEQAAKYGDPWVYSGDEHFVTENMKIVQDVRLAQSGNWRFYGAYHRFTGDEAFAYFRHSLGWSEYEMNKLIDSTFQWADMFKDFKLEYKPDLAKSYYPENTLAYLFERMNEVGRMDWNDPVWTERLKTEIARFHKNGVIDLLSYFYPMEDIINSYTKAGIICGPGRGSASGTGLAYQLGMTHIDPVKEGLSLDRFFNEDRAKNGKLPDFDQDLAHRKLLIGEMESYVEFELDDGEYRTETAPDGTVTETCIRPGTIKKMRKDDKVKTTHGLMTVHEALKYQVEILED